MKYSIENVDFTYENGLIVGQIWIHDFFLDVHREAMYLNTEEEFQKHCKKAYETIPGYLKGV